MLAFIDHGARLLLQYLLVVMLAATAWRVARRLIGDELGPRLTVAGIVFFSGNVVLIGLPGIAGWLTAPVVLALATVYALALNLMCGFGSRSKFASQAAPHTPPRTHLDRHSGWLIVPFLALATPHLLRALVLVPVDWDGLCYHLFLPVHWIQQQRIAVDEIPSPYTYFNFYQKNYECTLTLSMVVASNDLIAKWFTLPCVALSGLVTGLICRELGGHRLACWASAATVLTTINLLCMAATLKPDPMVIFATLAGVWLMLRVIGQRAQPRTLLFGSGMACGLAIGGKITAVLPAFVIGLVAPIAARVALRSWRGAQQGAALFALGITMTGGWWYAWNYSITGNPVYPMTIGPFVGIQEPKWLVNLLSHLSQLASFVPRWDGSAESLGYAPDEVRMTFGAKFYLLMAILTCALVGGAWRVIRAARRRDGATMLAWCVMLACIAASIYTYFRTPYWRADWFSSLERLALPVFLLSSSAAFALLSHLGLHPFWFWLVPLLGVLLDVPYIDLRVPATSAAWTALLIVAGVVIGCRYGARRSIAGAAFVASGLLLPFLHADREARRYADFDRWSEVHPAGFQRFAKAAGWLQKQYPGAPIAVSFNADFEFLYLYAGPNLERRVHYIPTMQNLPRSWKANGKLREPLDKIAWRQNIARGPDRLLLCHRSSEEWPPERAWAKEFKFHRAYGDESVEIFELPSGVEAQGSAIAGSGVRD